MILNPTACSRCRTTRTVCIRIFTIEEQRIVVDVEQVEAQLAFHRGAIAAHHLGQTGDTRLDGMTNRKPEALFRIVRRISFAPARVRPSSSRL